MVRVQIIQGKLDASMPASLQSYMTQTEWNNLAKEIGEAMAPAVRLQTCVPIAMVSWFFISIIIFASTFVLASSHNESPSLPIGPFVIVPLLFVLLLAWIIIAGHYSSDVVQKETGTICRRYTQRHTGIISFHMKQETIMAYGHGDHSTRRAYQYYLEVVSANAATTATSNNAATYPASTTLTPVVEATPLYYETSLALATTPDFHKDPEIALLPSAPVEPFQSSSVAERLTELGRIKHLLSKQEYQEKRKGILDTL